MRFYREDKELLAIAIAILVCMCFVLWGLNKFQAYQCEEQGNAMGILTNYKWVTGCMLHFPNGKVIPLRNYRGIDGGEQ